MPETLTIRSTAAKLATIILVVDFSSLLIQMATKIETLPMMPNVMRITFKAAKVMLSILKLFMAIFNLILKFIYSFYFLKFENKFNQKINLDTKNKEFD
jgi:hypothetical protein